MKPIVIYLDKYDDEIKLTRKEFEEYINKAYDQGYTCGYAEGQKYYPWWGNGGITYTGNSLDIKYTGKEYNPDYTQITCNTDKNSVFASGGNITATNSNYTGDNAIEKITATNGTNNTVFEAVSKALKELGEEK